MVYGCMVLGRVVTEVCRSRIPIVADCFCAYLHCSQLILVSINFKFLLTMLSLTMPRAVVLSVCIGVRGCLCPISSSVILAGTASRKLMNSAQSSALAVDDITALMII